MVKLLGEITAEEFEQVILTNELVIIDAYADWCGPCKAQGQIFEEKGEELRKDFPALIIRKMNSDNAPIICARYNVNAIPQLFVCYKGHIGLPKPGVQDIAAIKKIIHHIIEVCPQNKATEIGDPIWDANVVSIEELTENSFDAFITSHPYTLVLFYSEAWIPCEIMRGSLKSEGANLISAFSDLVICAVNLDKYPALGIQEKVGGTPTLVFYNKKIANIMPVGYMQMEEIGGFINTILKKKKPMDMRNKQFIPILPANDANLESIVKEHEYVVVLPWDKEERGSIRQLLVLQRDQDQFVEKLPSVVLAPLDCKTSPKIMNLLQIKEIPTNIIYYKGKYGKMLPGEKSAEGILTFIGTVVSESAKKSTKKEEVANLIIEQADPIIHLDVKDYDSFLKHNELVLIDFWAPWCGPCQSQGALLLDGYETLKKTFPNLTVAKLNTDEDKGLSLDRYNIDAIPQLVVFYKSVYGFMRGGTTPIDEIINFIKKLQKQYESDPKKQGQIIDERQTEESEDACETREDESVTDCGCDDTCSDECECGCHESSKKE